MKLPIVDQNDAIIRYKDRSDLDYTNDIFRTASLWITNKNGDILLAQRKMDKKVDPGKWAEAVGGTVEGDDTYKQTAVREAYEELGVKDLPFALGPKQFIAGDAQYFVQWYTAVIDQPLEAFTIQVSEVEQIAWISRNQLIHELDTESEKYIAAMRDIVKLFSA